MILAHTNVPSVFTGLGTALIKLTKLRATGLVQLSESRLSINGRKCGLLTCHEQTAAKCFAVNVRAIKVKICSKSKPWESKSLGDPCISVPIYVIAAEGYNTQLFL